ncbi:MAG TPA: hypothetical protein VEG08_14030 [Terriglobales bacterium]|nr:hypothetical protein [Terriglobales bacterium]
MKSFLSWMAALAVVAGLAAGGYYLYQQASGGGSAGSGAAGSGGHVMTASSTGVSLALTNGTHYVLTVTMKQGTELVRFEIAPGHTETKSFPAGTYSVDGKISDPSTDPFSTSWTFQEGQYNATFSRDQQTGQVAVLMEAGQAQGQSQGSQGKPKAPPKSRP